MAYSPAGNLTTSGGITHLPAAYYSRVALDQLRVMFRFRQVTEPDELPLRNGKVIQWFRYTLLASNTSALSEGVVGSSNTLTTTTVSATMLEYGDFITVSTFLRDVAIDPIVENAASQLGYSAGLSVDTLCRNEFDTNSGAELGTIGSAATVQDLRRAIAVLRGINVMPRDGNEFVAVIHPYTLFDIKADNTAGGFIDIAKFADPQRLISGNVSQDGLAGKVEGCQIYTTTNVKTSGSAPNVLYWMYIVGKGGVGAVSLPNSSPSQVQNPNSQNFAIRTIQGGPQIADPVGVIGAAVSYRYTFVAKTLDSTNLRYRMVKADASLV